MRRSGVPCYCDRKSGYEYKIDPNFFFPSLNLSRLELLGLQVIIRKFGRFLGIPNNSLVEQALCKISANVDSKTRDYCERAVKSIYVRMRPEPNNRFYNGLFIALHKAVLKRRSICLNYIKDDGKMGKEKCFDPYCLIYDDRYWYVFGKCGSSRRFKAVEFSKIKAFKILSRSFCYDSFDVEAFLRNAWGLKIGKDLHTIKLHFDADIAHMVMNFRWHDTQSVTVRSDGSAIVVFRLNHIGQILGWILSFGDKVKVLSPKVLVKNVAKTAKNIHELYRKEIHGCSADEGEFEFGE